jgi:hypothetical protein
MVHWDSWKNLQIINDGIRNFDKQNISKVNPSTGLSQVCEQKSVHLTLKLGKVFIDSILFNAEEFFAAQYVDLEMKTEVVEISGTDIQITLKT